MSLKFTVAKEGQWAQRTSDNEPLKTAVSETPPALNTLKALSTLQEVAEDVDEAADEAVDQEVELHLHKHQRRHRRLLHRQR